MPPQSNAELLVARQRLAQILRDLDDNQAMMRCSRDDGAFAAAVAVAWGCGIAGLDAARLILSRNPVYGALFTAGDLSIAVANHVLVSFRRAPIPQKSDLIDAMPPNLKLATVLAGVPAKVKSAVEAAPKFVDAGLKGVNYVQKNQPLVSYVLNVPVMKSHLWRYKNKLALLTKKVPNHLGTVIDAALLVAEDGALILNAYQSGQQTGRQNDAAIRQASFYVEKQRHRLNEMDRKIMYMFEQSEKMADIA